MCVCVAQEIPALDQLCHHERRGEQPGPDGSGKQLPLRAWPAVSRSHGTSDWRPFDYFSTEESREHTRVPSIAGGVVKLNRTRSRNRGDKRPRSSSGAGKPFGEDSRQSGARAIVGEAEHRVGEPLAKRLVVAELLE